MLIASKIGNEMKNLKWRVIDFIVLKIGIVIMLHLEEWTWSLDEILINWRASNWALGWETETFHSKGSYTKFKLHSLCLALVYKHPRYIFFTYFEDP